MTRFISRLIILVTVVFDPYVDHPGSFTTERDRRMIRWLAERLKGS